MEDYGCPLVFCVSCDTVFFVPVVQWLTKAKRIWSTWKKQPQDMRKEYVVSHCVWMVFG